MDPISAFQIQTLRQESQEKASGKPVAESIDRVVLSGSNSLTIN